MIKMQWLKKMVNNNYIFKNIKTRSIAQTGFNLLIIF
jgi:hypothetical protein